MKKRSLFVVLFLVFFVFVLIFLFFIAATKKNGNSSNQQNALLNQSINNDSRDSLDQSQISIPYGLPRDKEEAISILEDSINDLNIISAKTTVDSVEGAVNELTSTELKSVEESLNKTTESTIDSIETTIDNLFDQLNIN